MPVDPHQVESDIRDLYNAGQGRTGTDEITFCGIILNRSDAQLRQIAGGYKHHHRRSLESAIQSEFSGHMQEALLHAVQGALDPMGRDATLLEKAMEGAGTKDERLTYRIIRAHWKGGRHYLAGVTQAYQTKYKKNLIKRVKGETSGDYERLLVAVLEG
jgi:annexin A7/11